MNGPSDLEATRQELREALEQQAATSEVLKVISRSAADLQPVFDSVVTNANRLCAGDYGFVYVEAADGFRNVAAFGGSPEWIEMNRRELRHRGRDSLVGRVALEERVVQIPDVLEDPEYKLQAEQRAGGIVSRMQEVSRSASQILLRQSAAALTPRARPRVREPQSGRFFRGK